MITMEVETITPQVAAKYLQQNIKNYRPMSRAKIKQYAEDMKTGRWQLNGESIQFDENGILKNGQHRLSAVIMAGVSIKMTVMRGVAEDVTVYDLHTKRTALDVATASGLSVTKDYMSAINLLLLLRNGKMPTQIESAEYAVKHENELNRVKRCLLNGDYTKKLKRASAFLSCYLMLQTKKMPFYELEVFFRVFATGDQRGTDGYATSSAIVARRMFDERWNGKSNQRAQREQLDVFVQALNDMHNGRERTNNYKISQPFAYEPLLKVMKEG